MPISNHDAAAKIAFSDLWMDCSIQSPDLCPFLVFTSPIQSSIMGVAAALFRAFRLL
jgi:hypothetical protein